jgi:hypothetical protein
VRNLPHVDQAEVVPEHMAHGSFTAVNGNIAIPDCPADVKWPVSYLYCEIVKICQW